MAEKRLIVELLVTCNESNDRMSNQLLPSVLRPAQEQKETMERDKIFSLGLLLGTPRRAALLHSSLLGPRPRIGLELRATRFEQISNFRDQRILWIWIC